MARDFEFARISGTRICPGSLEPHEANQRVAGCPNVSKKFR